VNPHGRCHNRASKLHGFWALDCEKHTPGASQWVGASLEPNASIDRHSPSGAIKGGQAVEDDVGSMDHLQGCVRGRMLRLGRDAHAFCCNPRRA